MKDKNILRTGIIGTAIAAVCCFTPALVILVSAVGLSAVIGYLDFVLFPALGLFLALTAYAAYRMKRHSRDEVTAGDKEEAV